MVRSAGRVAQAAGVLLALGALVPSLGLGHPLVRRRDLLSIRPDRLTLTCELTIPPGSESRQLIEQLDRDASGRLDDEELASLRAVILSQATRHAKLFAAEAPLPLNGPALEFAPQRTVAELVSEGLVARARFDVPLRCPPSATVRLTLEDRAPSSRVEVPVRIELEGVQLTEALPAVPVVFAGHPLRLALRCAPAR